jgi:hypothetical protein
MKTGVLDLERVITIVWRQFGATIDMLENAIDACPAEVWDVPERPVDRQFWYLAYHTLFFLDYYVADTREGFRPPPPFTLDELDPAGVYPDRTYSKSELKSYLEYGRRRCRETLAALTAERAFALAETRPELSVLEHALYNLRHVQHHAAQLNLLLRQSIDAAPRWVSVARTPIGG